MAGYEHDLFISYSRYGSAPKWVLNHFYPKLMDCLADQAAPTPQVFLDKQMDRGVHWPSMLERALLHSKIMIAVLSAPYFKSAWCMAEWRSMCERERILGLTNMSKPQGLICAIRYSDSENFPDEGLQRSWGWDVQVELGTPDPVLQMSIKWIDFHKNVTDLARDLVELLGQVPDWRPDWPVVKRPDPVLMPTPKLPRL